MYQIEKATLTLTEHEIQQDTQFLLATEIPDLVVLKDLPETHIAHDPIDRYHAQQEAHKEQQDLYKHLYESVGLAKEEAQQQLLAIAKLKYDLISWFSSYEEVQRWLSTPLSRESELTPKEAIWNGNIAYVQDAFDAYVINMFL